MQQLFTCLLLFGLSVTTVSLQAQNSGNGTFASAASSLMESQTTQSAPLPSAPSTSEGRSASVSGAVLDVSGAAMSGAEVTLTEIGNSQQRSTSTGPDGNFTFSGLPSGSYRIVATASNFQKVTSAQFTLTQNQRYQASNIVLSVVTTSTEVVVRPTEVIAAQQMKAEEKQRLLGVIPDFYTSYIWDAAPLDTKQKFSLAFRDTFDPATFVGVSIGAGFQQATDAFSGYGQGAQGYGKRWGALFANGRTSDILSRAVFPSLFHQDPRYFYQGTGSTWSRTKHAVGYAFVARSDSGHLMPNYSYFLGDLCSGAISNAYYPSSNRGASLVFTNAAIGLAGRAGQDLVREFVSKRLTTHVPGNGKPAVSSGNP